MIRVLRTWGRDPLDPLPLALRADEDGIHDLRVAARRFRTVLPILVAQPKRPRVRRAVELLKRLGDVAGVSRDFDVKLGLLSAADDGTHSYRVLRERLDRGRAAAQRRLTLGLSALDLSRVEGSIHAVAMEAPEPLFVVLLRLGQQRDDLGRDILRRLVDAPRFRPEALHKLRIRIRRLRYLADMYGEIRGLATAAPALKSLQDVLGRVQDAWILSRWLAHQASLARRRGDARLADEARAQSQRWRDAAEAHHRKFLLSDPRRRVLAAWTALGGSRLVTRQSDVHAVASHRSSR